jgi:glycoside/pentoside/hexuronide:cation symporter, GPH family
VNATTATPTAAQGPSSLSWRDATSYGALGAPLAFVALPLYVHWPAFAADRLGLSLSLVGLVLLAMRCLDALIDPWLGSRVDGLFAQASSRVWRWMAIACVAVALGFAALFLPPASVTATPNAMVVWASLALGLTYLGYSVAQIAHQAWGARLGGSAPYRAKVVGARELFALAGVVVASVLPSVAGWSVTAAALGAMLLVGMAALRWAPAARDVASINPSMNSNASSPATGRGHEGLLSPWRHAEFRTLIVVYVANGLASAVPATLFLFYVRDHLQLPQHEAAFLLAYFLAAAVSVPLWTRVVARLGLVRTWACGMALAIASFVFAAWLPSGATLGYAAVCIGSGLALGADLVAPAALLAGVIQRSGVAQRGEGVWFGWWNLCTKLNLALAAGIALPLLQYLGFESGTRNPQGLQALVWVYALLPCAVKGAALAALLLKRWQEPEPSVVAMATTAASKAPSPAEPSTSPSRRPA